MLSEISQTEEKTKTVWDHLHIEVSKKYNRLMTISQKKQTGSHRKQTAGYQSWGEGKFQDGGAGVQTIAYKISYRVYYTTWGM